MGSEAPVAVTVHVTGFKKFHGVSENPTERIVSNLTEYMKKKGLPKGLILGSCNILEAAGQGSLAPLYQTLQSAININTNDTESSNNDRIIWLHFGVNSGAAKFAIEKQAVNEATFRCPDEMGWKPQRVPIIPSDGGISQVRETSLPVEEITKALAKKGYDVMVSDDAGRFVCNYLYYHSLRFAEQNGNKSLFVHVPLFLTIDEETQMQFAASLLEALLNDYQQTYFSGQTLSIICLIMCLNESVHYLGSLFSVGFQATYVTVPVEFSFTLFYLKPDCLGFMFSLCLGYAAKKVPGWYAYRKPVETIIANDDLHLPKDRNECFFRIYLAAILAILFGPRILF